jgi:hypothetical protein
LRAVVHGTLPRVTTMPMRAPPGAVIRPHERSAVGWAAESWRTSAAASAQTTLNLPVISSQACVLVLGLVWALACAAGVAARRSVITASASERAARRHDAAIESDRRDRGCHHGDPLTSPAERSPGRTHPPQGVTRNA